MKHVTCVMPTTAARNAFRAASIRWFLTQDYPDRDLLIVSDGQEIDVPDHPLIAHAHLDGTRSIGAKYNAALAMASGEYVALWEDDDWIGPSRLSVQMAAIEETGFRKCGTREMYFWDLPSRRMYVLRMDTPPNFCAHGSILAHRSLWKEYRYPDQNAGNDSRWQQSSSLVPAAVIPSDRWYVAMRHGQNSWQTSYSAPVWHATNHTLEAVIGEDAKAYEGLI